MLNSKRERNYEPQKSKFPLKNLPITKYKEEILKKISNNKITIISGETGCGKSTQIPQFLLEKNPNSKILMTQPRRIAAISLQKRIKKELEEKKIINDKIKNKGLIGYQVGMDKEKENITNKNTSNPNLNKNVKEIKIKIYKRERKKCFRYFSFR